VPPSQGEGLSTCTPDFTRLNPCFSFWPCPSAPYFTNPFLSPFFLPPPSFVVGAPPTLRPAKRLKESAGQIKGKFLFRGGNGGSYVPLFVMVFSAPYGHFTFRQGIFLSGPLVVKEDPECPFRRISPSPLFRPTELFPSLVGWVAFLLTRAPLTLSYPPASPLKTSSGVLIRIYVTFCPYRSFLFDCHAPSFGAL